MMGKIEVYRNKQLLYTLDRYYREPTVTSPDGQYVAVVHTSNATGIRSYTSFGFEEMDFNQPAIQVFKNGQAFKTFSLKAVIDTTKLAHNGIFFYWGYFVDYEAIDEALFDCEFWTEELTRKEKKECLNGNTTFWWIDGCEQVKHLEHEKFMLDHSIYVQDQALLVLTNQKTVVRLNFNTLTSSKRT